MSLEQRRAVYNVDGQALTFVKAESYKGPLLVNTFGAYTLELRFSREWKEFDRIALYLQAAGAAGITLDLKDPLNAKKLSETDTQVIYLVNVPSQILKSIGQITVGVTGYKSQDTSFRFPTTLDSSFKVTQSTPNMEAEVLPQQVSVVEKIFLQLYADLGGNVSEAQIPAAVNKAIEEGKITNYDDTEIKNQLNNITQTVHGNNMFDKNSDSIIANSQLSNTGKVQTNQSWTSDVTAPIIIDKNKPKTLRQTTVSNIFICQYSDESATESSFISKSTTFTNSSPLTLEPNTKSIRAQLYRNTKNLMIYQSDSVLPFEEYFLGTKLKEEILPDNIIKTDDLTDIENKIEEQSEKIDNIIKYDITNYALFVEKYENKQYDSSGKLKNTNDWFATSICLLDKKHPIHASCYNGHAVFFNENKEYISTVNCYLDCPVNTSDFPENAKYIAFDYIKSGLKTGEFATCRKNVKRNSAPQTVSYSKVKKEIGKRPVINIYTTDTQSEILSKLCDAYHTEDCDVIFEHGEYLFDDIYVDMYNNGQRDYLEFPIGGRNRYYFNGSTITSDYSKYKSSGNPGITVSMFSCTYTNDKSESYELYDGNLIGKGITYIVHDECGGKQGFYSHKYNNMHFNYISDAQTVYIRKCIGGGTGLFGESIFENCIFKTDHECDLSFHGISTDKEDVSHFKLQLSNCYLSKKCSLDTLSTNQTAEFIITGCSASTVQKTGKINGWDVISWNNEERTE